MQLYALLLLLSLVIGFVGRNGKFGFWGYFFASLLLTPFVGLLLVLASDLKHRKRMQSEE